MGVSDVLGFWMGWWWWWWECGSFENIDRKYRNSIPKHKVPFVCFKSVVVRTHLVNWINAMTRSPVCFSPFVAKMRIKKMWAKILSLSKMKSTIPGSSSTLALFYILFNLYVPYQPHILCNRKPFCFLDSFLFGGLFFPRRFIAHWQRTQKKEAKV